MPKYAREIADALGKRLGPIKPMPVDDPSALLSGFANPKMAEWIDSAIDSDLEMTGAYEATAPHRDGPRLVKAEGGHIYAPLLLPATPLIIHWPTASFYAHMPVWWKSLRSRCLIKSGQHLWFLPLPSLNHSRMNSCLIPGSSDSMWAQFRP